MSNDIGYFGTGGASASPASSEKKRTQVYQATHTGNDNRMTMYNRSFISFNYGGKWIEDFNLIATSSNNGIQRTLVTPFEDLMTDHEVADGYFYWGTRYTKKQIDFNLATDGITQPQLEEFRNWFKPGMTRELILAEHPNRAIDARVAAAPVMNVVPFEEKVDLRVKNNYPPNYTTGRNLLLDTDVERSVTISSENINNGNYYPEYYVESNYGQQLTNNDTSNYYAISFDWVATAPQGEDPIGRMCVHIYDSNNNSTVINNDYIVRESVINTSPIMVHNDETNTDTPSKNNIDLSGGSGHYQVVFKFTDTQAVTNSKQHIRIRIPTNSASDIDNGSIDDPTENMTVTIKNMKLEKGNKVTPWTLAPEDHIETSTTLYKGTITLSLIAAEPFWHSKVNILSLNGLRDTNRGIGVATNYDGRTLADYSEADAKELYKIVYEDGVPTSDIKNTLPSGYECTFGSDGVDDYFENKLAEATDMRLYYCGTAPCKPTVEFTITPEISDGGAIIFPYNVLYQQENSQTHEKYPTYNTITVGDKKLHFSTPSLYTGYNQAIHICDQLIEKFNIQAIDNVTKEEIRLLFINGINEYYSRAYAIHCLDAIDAVSFTESNINALKSSITGFLKDGNNTLTAKFTIDSERGTAIGLINCNVFTSDGIVTLNVKENVGDMLRSNYLIIDERNYPIFSETETPKLTTANTLPVETDFTFSELKFIYNYMYQ